MPTLTGHGGVHEIGGNAFLLDDGRSRLFLDFGKRYGSDRLVESAGRRPGWNDYFDEYLQPRRFRFVPDLLALGLVPDVPGVYREDLGGTPGPPAADAVLVSHAHMDHAGLVGLLRPDVPVLASAESRAVLRSVQETGTGTPESDYVLTRAKGRVVRRKDGSLTTRTTGLPDGPERDYRTGARAEVGDWQVETFPVDHSIPGAIGTIATGRDVSLVYTGDFRLHGRRSVDSERFLRRAAGCDVLVAEGTRVEREAHREAKESDHERDVEGQIEAFVTQADARAGADGAAVVGGGGGAAGAPGGRATGFVGISYPPRDVDRLVSIHAVAKRLGRRLVVAMKQAHLLEALRAAGRDDLPDPLRDPHVAIHVRAKDKGTILQRGPLPVARPDLGVDLVDVTEDERRALLESEYDGWERPYLDAPNAVTSLDVGAEPHAYLFGINFYTVTELFDIFPDRHAAGGLYIHSQTQPFNDDMVSTGRRLDRWLRAFHLDRRDTHVSGHLSQQDLEWAIDELRPRVLVPVHSHAPEVTAERYVARSGQRAALAVAGQPIPLGR